jgi:hypothetical protein
MAGILAESVAKKKKAALAAFSHAMNDLLEVRFSEIPIG